MAGEEYAADGVYFGGGRLGDSDENGGAVGGGDGGFIVGVGGVDAGCVTYHDAAGFGCFADYVRTPYTVFVKGVGPCSDGVDKVVVFGGVESCEGVGGVGVFGLVRSDVFSDCASGMDGLLNIDIVEEKHFGCSVAVEFYANCGGWCSVVELKA